ncbi:alkylresorcinol/alkylpyrone synthase [Microbacteriaceae bacterium SG_E_30_P1]|uniref:Alkylresorcinol/alkylpyrone synthase n=1 Tax=Antiquaquibacter oligotrophicus TaxID=2880260 RepID=A0ABT6KQQ1_9MICO|nr:3-oxoacyl-[acyl-carrier-protein] synthase III C-terminal domain-containing protein [Antiquaquibacter oligotrophicus]MDH6182308.1 alkylresorcinol/alkylpyrone synthase [Antiquaquibacter oligotrophicus]UDF12037.1 type III polyketide synthase [Antiquaquibacter oligotrophicus]
MSRIAAVAPVLPDNVSTQAEITAELAPLISAVPSKRAVLERMHAASGIGTRHTALPLEQYRTLGSFRESNDLFIACATDLAERALREALTAAGLEPPDVDFVMFTSVTGISAPSVDALLVQRLGLRSDVKRLPSFGLGCVGGAAGIARVNDYLAGHPGEVGVLLSVELCSLTLQRDDETIANFVATGLFGDGAAAVVLVGDDRPEPGIRVVDTRSSFYPDSTGVIGWNVGGTGFEIVLTAGVADVIDRHFSTEVAAFLGDKGLAVDDISTWVAHPGGPRVLEAFARSLDLEPGDFALSWASLDRVGNLSSSSVLHVLADTIEAGARGPGLLFALGPGVSAEFVLLEFP